MPSVIRYNTVAKEYLNSPDNPRLLQALSNLGIIDISDPVTYQNFMREFVNLKRMMKAAYDKDPELLFFVQPDTPNQLTYADLKEIKSPLSPTS